MYARSDRRAHRRQLIEPPIVASAIAAARFTQLGDAEVEDLDRAAPRDEQVGGLMSRCTTPCA
jgi:hypothetical protein